jgi:hypothetical protein
MFTKNLQRLLISLSIVTVFPLGQQAQAITPLTKAEIQEIRNVVQFIPKNSSQIRPARRSDTISPGDGVSTGRSSLADLRFNDGSLARVGEQAVFQFLPQTRNFTLSNGTVLLLIPPGRGQTRIKTPNAAAAIRGSALFVRYNPESNTTIIGALTNSGIEAINQDASQNLVLKAGQLMVVVDGKFQGLYDFDLRDFYERSSLVRDLDLTRQNSMPIPDPALASVQAETVQALAEQRPIAGENTIDNPSFLTRNAQANNSENRGNGINNNSENRGNGRNNNNPNRSGENSNRSFGRSQQLINRPFRDNSGRDSIRNNPLGPIDSFVRTGEVIRENRQRNNPGGGNTNRPGNSDGVPGGGNTNRPGNSDGVPGGGNTNGPGNSDGDT